ncbi:MAG TPA: hypothetical protein VG722_06270 [Tepidisphaeraceae bacterium]|nr:hypothetical protein [Tepidisphaeraceae bacterium]
MSEKPILAIGVVVVLIAVVLAYSIHVAFRPNPYMSASFTIDDGQTVFVDSARRIAPFDHDGKPADRAYMYTCDGGKTRFVGYLEHFTQSGKAKLVQEVADFDSGKRHSPPMAGPDDIEVRKPGPSNSWINRSDPRAEQVVRVSCPNGGTAEPVFP